MQTWPSGALFGLTEARRKLARRIAVRTLSAPSLVALVLVLAGIAQSRLAAHKAKVILAAVKELRAGQSTFDDVQKVLQLTGDSYPDCDAEVCDVQIIVTNSWYAKLHLAPLTYFSAVLQVRNGVFVYSQIGEVIPERGAAAAWQSSTYHCQVRHRQTTYLTDIPTDLLVFTSSKCSSQFYADAYAFETGCLSKFGGCADAEALNPRMWNSTMTR